jgi:disulfide bond formation protein DsbB
LLQIFAFSILISLYHLGIEQGLVKESSVCISDNTNLITKENILNSLKEFKVSCKDVTFRFFNLSLTTYNMFLSIIMFLIALKVYLIKRYEEK